MDNQPLWRDEESIPQSRWKYALVGVLAVASAIVQAQHAPLFSPNILLEGLSLTASLVLLTMLSAFPAGAVVFFIVGPLVEWLRTPDDGSGDSGLRASPDPERAGLSLGMVG